VPRETKARKVERALEVSARLDERYPHTAQVASLLAYNNAFTLVIAVLLSAQTTDAAVNKVTPILFGRYPDAPAMAAADPLDIETIIKSIGFYHVKARHCVECARKIMTDFGGEVPHTMRELETLPGVGHKTANIVMNTAFGEAQGIAVDTHVFRISHKLGFSPSTHKTPEQVERDLMGIYPREYWSQINHQFVMFGREVCVARRPKCDECPIAELCPSRQD
jgi:endonuclease-3